MAGSITWLGHAAFAITSPQGKVVYIDPFIDGNPFCPITVADIQRADIVLVTHDHFDHTGSAVDIVKKTGATLMAQPETTSRFIAELGMPGDRGANFGMGMNIGATIAVAGIEVTMTQACHSSQTASNAGFIVRLEDGYTIYHAGDTGIFATMKLFGEMYPLDMALLPIGSGFVMDPYQAAKALALLSPRKAIPMHYKTFPVLEQSADRFVELARREAPSVEVIVPQPGQEVAL
ncbi:MAG: metal-dependent hydrolase [Chloroflexota bacterium]|nr:metal-dependent hydrolase [Chloroflexota bacterium]